MFFVWFVTSRNIFGIQYLLKEKLLKRGHVTDMGYINNLETQRILLYVLFQPKSLICNFSSYTGAVLSNTVSFFEEWAQDSTSSLSDNEGTAMPMWP